MTLPRIVDTSRPKHADGRYMTQGERDAYYERLLHDLPDIPRFDFTIGVYGNGERIEIEVFPMVEITTITRDVERFMESLSPLTYGVLKRAGAEGWLNDRTAHLMVVQYLVERRRSVLDSDPLHPWSHCKNIDVIDPPQRPHSPFGLNDPRYSYHTNIVY